MLVVCVILASATGGAAEASCAGPPPGVTPKPFDAPLFVGRLVSRVGEGTVGTLFAFDVESVRRGVIPKRAVVDIDVAQYFRRPDGEIIVSSSTGSIEPLHIGARYRVEAYVGHPAGEPRMFINECGGSLRSLPPLAGGASWGSVLSVLISALLLLAAALGLRRRSKPTDA